jgi:hypothetical protein
MWTLVLLWDFSNQCPHLLSQLRHAKAPWLHGRYAASTLLRTSPTPPPPARALWISTHALLAWRETGGRGLSSSWWFLLRALSPLTPESPTGASGRSLRIDAGFTSSGRLGHPQLRLTRPNRVRASLRLAHLPPPAPIGRLAPPTTGSATWLSTFYHDEHFQFVGTINLAWRTRRQRTKQRLQLILETSSLFSFASVGLSCLGSFLGL